MADRTWPPMDQMDREWRAWRQVCKHLENHGVNVNAADSLVAALKLWGEELGVLRHQQRQELGGGEQVNGWVAGTRAAYHGHEMPEDGA